MIDIPFDPAAYVQTKNDWRVLAPEPARAVARLARLGRARADRTRLWEVRAKLAATNAAS